MLSSPKVLRILVVEDEPFNAFDLMMAVEEAGVQAVGPAATVAEAHAFIGTHASDGAILDVNIPDRAVGPVLNALSRRAGMACLPKSARSIPTYRSYRSLRNQRSCCAASPPALRRRLILVVIRQVRRSGYKLRVQDDARLAAG